MKTSSVAPAAMIVLAAIAAPLHAAYPEKPVRIVVPFAPGGTTDILARMLSRALPAVLGQSVIVENRAGAAGNIGTELVAKAKPDGYTLLVGLMNTHVVNQALYPKLPFDGVADFTPIAMLADVVTTMAIHPSLPARDVKQLIALAKTRPGQIAYASAGTGSSTHLNVAVFEKLAGIELLHVPYKGGAPAVLDTVAGQTQMIITAATQTLPHASTGRLRLLGVTRAQRVAMLPDVPAIAESLPGYEALVWYGAFGPAGLPNDITARLNREINQLMSAPETSVTLRKMGVEPLQTTPAAFQSKLREEAAHWAKVVRQYGIKIE
ncbi:MAG: tripartite tricarboxylate transporter substrate binding protein [Burkholderiales bacterium]|nr:tripartite tricarboxylate transporter substrate binding protein [Burkholderiales bacterium]